MTQQKYVESSDFPLRWREFFQIGISAILLLTISIIFGEIVNLLPSWNGMELLGVAFSVPIMLFWYMQYFTYKSYKSTILDPWIPKKLLLFFMISVFIIPFYRPESISIRLSYCLMGSNIILCYFFKRYLLGIGRKDYSLEQWVAIRSVWLSYPVGFTITGISLHYLGRTSYTSSRELLLVLSTLSLILPAIFVGVYRYSVDQSEPLILKKGKISDLAAFICRSANRYPINTRIGTSERLRSLLRKVGEIITKRILQLFREEDEKDEEFEQEYVLYMGYAFAFYVMSVYVSTIMWKIVHFLPTEYEILPPFDMGGYGLILVFYGSLCLAADPLTDLPYVDNVTQPLIVAVSQLGFLLLATGTFLQISAYISPQILQNEYTYVALIESGIISENDLSTVMAISKGIAAFTATPLSLTLLYLAYMRVQFNSNEQK